MRRKVKAGGCLFGYDVVNSGEGLGHGPVDGLGADGRVGLHDVKLLKGQLARLEEDRVGDADLAEVMKRRSFDDHVEARTGKRLVESLVVEQGFGQDPNVVLGAEDVMAGFVVAGLGQARECPHGEGLRQNILLHSAGHLVLQPLVLVREPVAGILQFELGAHAGKHDGGVNGLGDIVDGALGEPRGLRLRCCPSRSRR